MLVIFYLIVAIKFSIHTKALPLAEALSVQSHKTARGMSQAGTPKGFNDVLLYSIV